MKKESAITKHISVFVILSVGILAIAILLVIVQRVEAARQEFYSYQDTLRLYRSEIWHLGKLDPATLQKQLEAEVARFPTKEGLVAVIQELNEVAKKNDVGIDALSPKDSIGGESVDKTNGVELDRIPIEMKLRSTFYDLSSFVSALSHLDHGLVKVERLELNSKEPKLPILNLSVQGSVYIKKSTGQPLFDSKTKVQVDGSTRVKPKSRYNDLGRNPFSETDDAQKSALTIEGIIYDPVKPMALVNGEVRRVGDEINGMRIVEITKGSVIVEKDGKRSETLFKPAGT